MALKLNWLLNYLIYLIQKDIASIPSITLTNEHEYFHWIKAQSTNTSNSTKQFSSDSFLNNKTQCSDNDILDRTPENIKSGFRFHLDDRYSDSNQKKL